MRLCDAHNHLHDRRLDRDRPEIMAALGRMGIRAAVVNGTSEEDWPAVAALAAEYSWVRPSFGLHPWRVAGRSREWREKLLRQLDAHPRAMIGEIGLDRWVEGHDLALQTEIFHAQVEIAAERNLPVAVHCLRAWGALWDAVRAGSLPACGFLLHSYGGPAEMVEGFAGHGAYFSFSGYYLAERKEAQREVFRKIPPDRLLVETDAPDMAPPAGRNLHPLREDADGKVINHPANLEVAYAGLAEVRGVRREVLAGRVEENFGRLFGG